MFYNIRKIPNHCLRHRIFQCLQILVDSHWRISIDMLIWIFAALVSTANVDDAEGAALVVGSFHTTALAKRHNLIEILWLEGYYLEHAPGIFLGSQQDFTLLLRYSEIIYN